MFTEPKILKHLTNVLFQFLTLPQLARIQNPSIIGLAYPHACLHAWRQLIYSRLRGYLVNKNLPHRVSKKNFQMFKTG